MPAQTVHVGNSETTASVNTKAIQSKVDNDILLAGGTISRVAITGIKVSPTSANIFINETKQLTVTASPSNATNKNIGWSVSRMRRTGSSFQCCIKDEGEAPHIGLAGGVYKPLQGAVIKSYGAER